MRQRAFAPLKDGKLLLTLGGEAQRYLRGDSSLPGRARKSPLGAAN